MELVWQLKKLDNTNANAESIFVLKILEKIKETRLKFSEGSVTEYKRWKFIKKRELN